MDADTLRTERLRSQRISAPARSVEEAASALTATQAQEFWGGRWALALRTRGTPPLSRVDAAFASGAVVRSWTARGTLHLVATRDLGWLLDLTGERQFRLAASRHRTLGLDEPLFAAAERAVRAALAGGGRMTRAELFDLFRGLGVDPADQRGVHLLVALSVRQVIVQGPVVPRADGPTREQWFVLVEEWVRDAAYPADPLAELAARFVAGHGPAGAADLAWWSGLPLGVSRTALAAAADRVIEVEEGLFAVRPAPRRSAVPDVVLLPPYDEYFLSYADRTVACPRDLLPQLALGGVMRPMLLARGGVVGWWSRAGTGAVEIVERGAVTDAEASAALARFRGFLAG